MKFRKKQTKRMTCRRKYKIEKKVKDHNKKVTKEAKKKAGKPNRKVKELGVPNKAPFKEDILREAVAAKERAEAERARQMELRKKEREKILKQKRSSLDSMVKDAQKRTAEFDRKKAFEAEASKHFTGGKSIETSLKAYYKEFRKVVDNADVVLQVLDARDPIGSRCPQVEEAVLSAGTNKKMVLLLNKIDLVPKENVEKWLKYLRNEFPTVAFKASTQSQKERLSQMKVSLATATEDKMKTSRCLGADTLMTLLGNYCRNQDIKTSITVGVVGFPNTGKSSIINSLKRSRACGVGSTPGFTKTMQEIHLDKHIKLLDSPGIVMATNESDASRVLRNCVRIETLQDVITPVEAILKRCNKQQMMMHYNLPDYADVHEFLESLAKRFGKLKKGGLPDVDKAAKTILQDWTQGKITYYTEPPENYEMSTHLSADIVTQMGKAFDLEALSKDEEETLKGLANNVEQGMVIESSGPTLGQVEMDNDEQDNEEDEQEKMDEESDEEKAPEEEMKNVKVRLGKGSRSRSSTISSAPPEKKEAKRVQLAENQQKGKQRKKDFKIMKKNRKRADKLSGNLSAALEGAFSGLGGGSSESYDFSVL